MNVSCPTYEGHNAEAVNALLRKLSQLQIPKWSIASAFGPQPQFLNIQRKLRSLSILAGLSDDVDLAQSLARDLTPSVAMSNTIVESAAAAVVLGPERLKRDWHVLATYPLRAAGIDFDYLSLPDATSMHDALVSLGKTAMDAPEVLATRLAEHLTALGIEA